MKRCPYYAKIKTATMLCILTTLGCHSQVTPLEKPTPTEKDSPQGISHLLPNGGALLFLCTCSQCKTTIKTLEPLLSAQPKLRSSIVGLTSMNTADNLRFRKETQASFSFFTDDLNSIREKYNVSQCPRLICLSKSGNVKYDTGQGNKPLSTAVLRKALQVALSAKGGQP